MWETKRTSVLNCPQKKIPNAHLLNCYSVTFKPMFGTTVIELFSENLFIVTLYMYLDNLCCHLAEFFPDSLYMHVPCIYSEFYRHALKLKR